MKELKRHEIMRRIERQDADKQQPAQEPSLSRERQVNLKKQSHFVTSQRGTRLVFCASMPHNIAPELLPTAFSEL